LGKGDQAVKNGRLRLRATVLALACLASASAAAFDPALHQTGADNPYVQYPTFLGLTSGDTAGVAVSAITDIGPNVRGNTPGEPPDDLWQRIRIGFAMPDLASPLVVERQAWYAERPQQIQIMVERSRRYLFHIVEELEKRGMPTELALLPMVESAFNPMAYSSAKASGLWQFIPSTGRQYNLEQNWWYDARRDIVASTTAALDYLQYLYGMWNDWHLALASYNWGEGAVGRAIERNRARGLPTDYQSLDMPSETRYYIPKLQALKNIVMNPQAAGLDLAPIPNAPYFVTVTLTRDIDLRVAARLADMPLDELITLNPGHNRPVVSAAVAPTLILPSDRAEVFARNLERNDKPLSNWQTYTFRSGDRLEKIAADYGTSVAKLRAVNGLGPRSRVKPGAALLVPQKGYDAAPIPGQAQAAAATQGRTVHYTVRRGDTISGIARSLGVAVAVVKQAAGAKLTAGERLTFSVEGTTAAGRTAAPSAKSRPPAKATPKFARGGKPG
jgi:membrane-bound lytic murein transglycosylase D